LVVTLFGSQSYERALKLLENQETKKGVNLLIKLAETGNADAQLDLYDFYNEGYYFKKNPKKAMYWIKKAAKTNSTGMALLGVKYYEKSDYREGKKWLDKAAKLSNPVALRILGNIYKDGVGIKQSCKTSYDYYVKAAKVGSSKSAEYIFWAYNDGNNCIKKNYKLAKKWLLKAVKLDSPSALRVLGYSQLFKKNKFDIKYDYKQAEKNLMKSAELGDVQSMYVLANEYELGSRLKQDFDYAAKIYQVASDNGHKLAQYRLGTFYYRGVGVKKDYKKSCDMYEKSISYPGSSYNLATCYQNGEGRKKDLKLASKYFLDAANKLHLDSQLQIAMDYHFGRAGEINYTKARSWYKKVINNYHSAPFNKHDPEKIRLMAKYNLANLIYDGKGGASSHNRAFKLYKEAAKGNESNAQNTLGIMYFEGHGTKVDKEKAKYWFKKSAAHGNENAKENLSRLY